MSRFPKNKAFAQHSTESSTGPSLRLNNALNRARLEGVINLSSMNLRSIPSDVFDLRAGLLDNGDGSIKPWECYCEEACVSFDVSHNEGVEGLGRENVGKLEVRS